MNNPPPEQDPPNNSTHNNLINTDHTGQRPQSPEKSDNGTSITRSEIDASAMALVALMIEGSLSDDDREEIRGRFAANPALLQTYVEQAMYNAMLRWRHALASSRAGSQLPTADEFYAAAGADQTFAVQGELTVRTLPGDSGSFLSLRAVTGAQIPGPPLSNQLSNQQNVYQLIVESPPKVRPRRWSLPAAFAVTTAILAAAIAFVPSILPRPPEQGLPAVHIDFDSWDASGGKFRKEIESPEVTLVPNGLVYPNLACSGGALRIDSPDRQQVWFDLDAGFVVPSERAGLAAALPMGGNRGADAARPRLQARGSAGTTVYLSFLIRAENPVASGFCGLSLFYGPDGKGETLFVGKANGLPSYSYVNFEAVKSQKRLLDAQPNALTSGPIPLDTATHLIVTRIDFREGQDRFAIYFDPDPTKAEPKQPNKTDVARIAFDRIRLSAGREKGQEQPTVWYLDEIRLADSYRAAVPVAAKTRDAEPKN